MLTSDHLYHPNVFNFLLLRYQLITCYCTIITTDIPKRIPHLSHWSSPIYLNPILLLMVKVQKQYFTTAHSFNSVNQSSIIDVNQSFLLFNIARFKVSLIVPPKIFYSFNFVALINSIIFYICHVKEVNLIILLAHYDFRKFDNFIFSFHPAKLMKAQIMISVLCAIV